MEGDFFTAAAGGAYFDDHLDSSASFSGMPVAPSDPAQVGGWWDGSVDFNGLDSSGLLCHSMESESLQHIPNNPPNGTFDKGNSNEHNIQQLHQGGCVMVPSSSNERFHNLNPWPIFPDRHSAGNAIPQELERAMMYRHSPVSGHQEFALEPQHMSAFYDSFRSGTDVPDQPPPFLTPFTAADLGTLSQPQNADDTASLAYSQASCNSKCTSSVCENENCSVTGTPCDDPTCVENICAPVPIITNFRTQVASGLTTFRQLHGQPCNHTESEHLVARTLGELRAPAESDDREKSPYATKFDYTLVSRAGDQFYDGIYQPSPSPAQLTSEAECSVSNNMQTPLQPISSLPITPNGASHPERHICQWITNTDTHQGFPETCGAEFSNAKDFHDHLCTFHIDKLTSQTGFACLWAGCPREQCQPFVTRGKLRRHILTHSVYKPYTCSICNLGFSGQQALQQHVRTHTGLKPFKCTFEGCTRAFKQKSALTMHSRVHTGEKPLKCEYCGKAFPESSNLSKHRKIHSVKSDKYVCGEVIKGETCGRAFRRLDQLRRHRDTHYKTCKKKTGRNRSMSTPSNVSGEVLDHSDTPTITGV